MKHSLIIISLALVCQASFAGTVRVNKFKMLNDKIDRLELKLNRVIDALDAEHIEKSINRQNLTAQSECHNRCMQSNPWPEWRDDKIPEEEQKAQHKAAESCHKSCDDRYDKLIPPELKVYGC